MLVTGAACVIARAWSRSSSSSWRRPLATRVAATTATLSSLARRSGCWWSWRWWITAAAASIVA
eukprot:7596897-Heterocapsa_arctica.AAC.1